MLTRLDGPSKWEKVWQILAMKTYTCTCGQLIFFENVTCLACGRELGFLPDVLRLSSLEPAENGLFKSTEAAAKSNSTRNVRTTRRNLCAIG